MSKNKFNDAHKPKNRPPRVGLNPNKLSLDATGYKREGYHLSWVKSDVAGKVDDMLAAWYDFVQDDEGNHIEKDAGRGVKLVLMEIEQKYYDEDVKEQQDALTKRTLGITRLNPGEYILKGRDKVLEQIN